MKILTLNKRQRSELIEMCKEFVPDHSDFIIIGNEIGMREKNFTYQKTDGWGGKGAQCYDAVTGKKIKAKLYLNIHWYQLCLTELPKRIFSKLKPQTKLSGWFFETWGYGDLHVEVFKFKGNPVDFLWNFVQDCKKNKYFKK